MSSAGLMMNYIWHEQARVATPSDLQVLAVGNSRMDFDTALANSLHTGCELASIAVPGTLPRVWYYMLREADPKAGRVSYESALGKAMIGRKVGEVIEVKTEGGRYSVRIVGIT